MSQFPIVCAAVTTARLGEARLLGEAVRRCHPGETLVLLIVDAPRNSAAMSGPFELLDIDTLEVPAARLAELALCGSGDELARCLAPSLLRSLLRDQRAVVLLDPGVVLLGSLGELADQATADQVVLFPRSSAPLPDDGRSPRERDRLAAGRFDPDCVVVGPSAGPFLHWWEELLQQSVARTPNHLSGSSAILDCLPESFAVVRQTSSAYGLSSWNAHERQVVVGESGEILVDNKAARTIHLGGFDPRQPSLLDSELCGMPRVLLSEQPVLAQLCAERAQALVADPRWDGNTRFSHLADGTAVDDRMRRIVRRSLARHSPGGTSATFADPFSESTVSEFHAWLAAADPSDSLAPRLPRYLREIYADRRDLQWHFPRVGNVDGVHFRSWVEHHGLDEEVASDGLRRAIEASSWWIAPTGIGIAAPAALRAGVTLAGYLRAEVGLGEAARLVRDALEHARVEVSPVVIATTASREGHPVHGAASIADRLVNVVWANADQLPGFASIVGPEFFAGRYTVGGWVWETEQLPRSMADSAVLVDEIWAPSAFACQAIAASVDRPVQLFPHPIVIPTIDPAFDRAKYGLGDAFSFLVTYDYLSSFERKNPLGAIDAFCRAFRPGEGPQLVLKSVNGENHPAQLEQVRLAAGRRSDIQVIDAYLSAGERASLIAACDCYLSLHRSEGFGLGLAEAMALGRPVIATAYSGNLEFMDEESAYLVPAGRVAVGPAAPPYEPTALWADPDLDIAASLMRQVYEDPSAAARIADRGRARVLDGFGLDKAARFVSTRLAEIEGMRRKGYVSTVADALTAWL